jgi:hypothetical protein
VERPDHGAVVPEDRGVEGPGVLGVRGTEIVSKRSFLACDSKPKGTSALTATQGWFAIDALGRARWTPLRHVSLELEGGGRLPTIRNTFEFFTPAESPIKPVLYVPAALSAVFDADVRFFF